MMTQTAFVSAFDLDYTLLNVNSSYCFGRFLCRRKYFPRRALFFMIWCQISFVLGWISITQLHERAFRVLFKGRPAELVQKWVNEFLQEAFDQLLYIPAFNKLQSAHEAGHLTVMLSSSPEFLVAPIAKRLGIPLWQSTRYAVDKEGRFCHIDKLMLGEDKALYVRDLLHTTGINHHAVTAYSDSHLDLPFLLSAGIAVGVNPDRKLRKLCELNEWPII